MQSVKVKARIHSLDGEMDEVTVVEKKEGNNYIVEYKGQKYTLAQLGKFADSTDRAVRKEILMPEKILIFLLD